MNKYTLLIFSTGLLVSSLLTGQPRQQGKPDFSNIEGKPDGDQSLERPKPRELISAEIDIKNAVKNGKIPRKEAGQKLKALHEKFRENIKAKEVKNLNFQMISKLTWTLSKKRRMRYKLS